MMTLSARYFDGRSSRAHPVTLSAAGDRIAIIGVGLQRQLHIGELQIGERLGSAPRRLALGDGAYVEATDHAALEALLASAGHRFGGVERAQRSGLLVAAALAAFLLIALAGYRFALPAFVDNFARQMPKEVLVTMSDQLLEFLDNRYLAASKLPEARRLALQQRFNSLKKSPDTIAIEILFRNGKDLGPNALALPDGRVVLLDELVQLAASDDEVIAVLAHESMHVQERHGVRALLRGTVVATASAWWMGDISSLLALAPTVLLNSRYSRELEATADSGAATLLKANGLPASLLASMLRKLEAAKTSFGEHGGWAGYLDSHPATAERIQRLESGEI